MNDVLTGHLLCSNLAEVARKLHDLGAIDMYVEILYSVSPYVRRGFFSVKSLCFPSDPSLIDSMRAVVATLNPELPS
jgi:hypothetical protein